MLRSLVTILTRVVAGFERDSKDLQHRKYTTIWGSPTGGIGPNYLPLSVRYLRLGDSGGGRLREEFKLGGYSLQDRAGIGLEDGGLFLHVSFPPLPAHYWENLCKYNNMGVTNTGGSAPATSHFLSAI